ncbi:MAG: putative zinc-binding peptidase, partial [Acidimicrobiales bacterium]|nr:putative zinc-binding peptidase [Acidimicrobiales bacterium]
MTPFRCSVCDQLLFFENSTCLGCGSALGFDPSSRRLEALRDDLGAWIAAADPERRFVSCANRELARCNWLVPAGDPEVLCRSCRLTTVRPSDDDPGGLQAFAEAETAKRRLLHQLFSLGLEIVDRREDPTGGLAFEMLSSRNQSVITGHEDGVITLDLSESDDVHREFVRQQLGEAYRTVLGHLRHEIGHYYWPILVVDAGRLDEFRGLFGDERISYEDAKQAHYSDDGAGTVAWSVGHVSEYATMHPWEDWAETFAHYLHIRDGLETAASFGVVVSDPADSVGHAGFDAPAGLEVS